MGGSTAECCKQCDYDLCRACARSLRLSHAWQDGEASSQSAPGSSSAQPTASAADTPKRLRLRIVGGGKKKLPPKKELTKESTNAATRIAEAPAKVCNAMASSGSTDLERSADNGCTPTEAADLREDTWIAFMQPHPDD